MVDKDENNINDTLIIELTTNGNSGTYLISIDLYDKNVIKNETNKTLSSGANKFNITFSTDFFTKNKFNYTIKVYEENYSLKYSKENIETQFYNNYETTVNIVNISDKSINNRLQLNFTINFTKNNTYEIIAYLGYNNSIIFSKINQNVNAGVNNILMNFNNETIKNTHYIGKFNLTSLKLNNKIIKTDYLTNLYDYKDFAQTSYFAGFSDYGFDLNNNNLFDFLKLNTTLEIKNNDSYKVDLALYDLFSNFIAQENKTQALTTGTNNFIIDISGTKVYNNKLSGPFILKYAKLMKNNDIIDQVNDFYTTQAYNYTNFEKPDLPDLNVSIDASEDYFENNVTYNITFNVTVKNIGNKAAYNIFLEIFDNYTYSRNESLSILSSGDSVKYTTEIINISDIELNAIVDFDNFIEESNESNNVVKKTISKETTSEQTSTTDTPTTASSGSGGGGGTIATTCAEQWNCSQWSNCINSIQTRTCQDINNCQTTNKPLETQECSITEEPKTKEQTIKEKATETTLENSNEKDTQNKPEYSLPGITGFLAGPPENANKNIGTLIMSVIVILGLSGYFYFLHKPI
ncbi:MAG: CARDB domain-containing protein [Candidatus Woesearchaeota archaeon]